MHGALLRFHVHHVHGLFQQSAQAVYHGAVAKLLSVRGKQFRVDLPETL